MEVDWYHKHVPWLFLILGTCVQGFTWHRRARYRIEANPALESGYRSLLRGWLFWLNLPWAYMGLGVLTGQIGWFPELFLLRDSNLFVASWWALIVLLLALGTYWIWLRGGAEMLEKHPGVMMVPLWNAKNLRLFWLGVVLWNVTIASLLFSGIIPINSEAVGRIAEHSSETPSRTSSEPPEYFFLFFPFLFIGLWILVGFILSNIGGWKTLANLYPDDPVFEGTKFRFKSGNLGSVGYGSCLIFEVNQKGIRCSIFILFRLFHPPFFVPWEDLAVSEERFLFFRSARFTFKKLQGTELLISSGLAKKLLMASKQDSAN